MKKNKIEPLNIQVAKKAKRERFRKEFDLYATEVSTECPIIIQRGAVLLDTISGSKFLQLKLSNAGKKEVRSAYIKLNCFDDTGDIVGNVVDIAYSDINCIKDACFGDKVLSSIPRAAKVFRFEEIKIAYADGTSERFGKDCFHTIPESKPLKVVIAGEYHGYLDSQKDLRVQPEIITENMSRCICGGLIIGSGKCANCGRDFQQAGYDATHIEELHTNYLAEEQKKQHEKEQKRLAEITVKYQKYLNILSIAASFLLFITFILNILYIATDFGLYALGQVLTVGNVLNYICTLIVAVAMLRQNHKLLLCGVGVRLLLSWRAVIRILISRYALMDVCPWICLLIGVIIIIKGREGKWTKLFSILALVFFSINTIQAIGNLPTTSLPAYLTDITYYFSYALISSYLMICCHIRNCAGVSGGVAANISRQGLKDKEIQQAKISKNDTPEVKEKRLKPLVENVQQGSKALKEKAIDAAHEFDEVKETHIKPFVKDVRCKSKVLKDKAVEKAHETIENQKLKKAEGKETADDESTPRKSPKKVLKILIIIAVVLVVVALAVVIVISHNKKVIEEKGAYFDSILSEENLYGTWKLTILPDPKKNREEKDCLIQFYSDIDGNICCRTDYFAKYHGSGLVQTSNPNYCRISGYVMDNGKVNASIAIRADEGPGQLDRLSLGIYGIAFEKFSKDTIYFSSVQISGDTDGAWVDVQGTTDVIAIMERVQSEQFAESVMDIYDYAGAYEEVGVDGIALKIFADGVGSCNIDISMYRLGEFSGQGELNDKGLIFSAASGDGQICGQITLNSAADVATVEITGSDFSYIGIGDIFEYEKTISSDSMIAQ